VIFPIFAPYIIVGAQRYFSENAAFICGLLSGGIMFFQNFGKHTNAYNKSRAEN